MMTTIGLPNAGRQAYYNVLWKTFFEELGFKIIISGETTKEIVDKGVKNSEMDFCFAIKIYVGHVLELKNKVDYIFVPSMAGLKPYYCPYHVALPDLIKNMFKDIKLLTGRIQDDGTGIEEVAKKFNKSDKEIKEALEKARIEWKEERLNEMRREEEKLKLKKPKIAIIGADDYISKDKFCLMNIPELLEKNGFVPVFLDHLKYKEDFKPGFRLQWIIEQEIINKLMDFFYSKQLDGAIYIVPFSCGPCFLIQEQVLSKFQDKKILVLHIDESQNETRIKTRIEAFLDVVKK